jgi:hypothetical protein
MTLQYWKEHIKEQRKDTPFREYVKQIVSRFPVVFHKTQGSMSRYPDTSRIGYISSNKDFSVLRDALTDYALDYTPEKTFFQQFQELFSSIPL